MEEKKLTDDKITISSGRKWLWLGIIVALVNPVFAGLIMGAVYLSEPELKSAGKIVAVIAILWGAILLYLLRQNFSISPLGV